MKKQQAITRRQFLMSSAVASAGLILPESALAGKTKEDSSGVEPPALHGPQREPSRSAIPCALQMPVLTQRP